MGIVSSLYLHEKSHWFCKAGNGRAFSHVLCAIFQAYNYQRTETSPCITNFQENVTAVTNDDTKTKFMAVIWKNTILLAFPFRPCLSRHLPEAGSWWARRGSAVVLVHIRQQRSCAKAVSAELASESVSQKRRKLGKNL